MLQVVSASLKHKKYFSAKAFKKMKIVSKLKMFFLVFQFSGIYSHREEMEGKQKNLCKTRKLANFVK